MKEEATLKINNGQAELTLFIPKNDDMDFKKLELNGIKPSIQDTGESNAYTYKLKTLVGKIPAVTTYEVPFLGFVHENLDLDFELVGLDKPPKKTEEPEKDEPTEAPEARVVGKLVTEDAADAVYELDYETDSSATEGQLLNPVKLLEKD